MLADTVYWLLILSTAAGKLVAVGALLVFAIALPLTRMQAGTSRPADLGIAAFGLLGLYLMLENSAIFLAAA